MNKKIKFDVVIANPPYTFGGKGGKTAIPAFLDKAMEASSDIVLFVCPAWYAVKSNQDSSKWKGTIAKLNNFGVEDIKPFDNKHYFPNVDFMHAAITHLSKSSNGVVSDFTDQFASQGRPDNTDVERIVTRRGASISHKSSDFADEYSKDTPYRMVTSMSNNGEFEATVKYYKSLEASIKSPWAVVVQEQAARKQRINDAVIIDNTKGDVGVLANVYPIYCTSKEDAETVKAWVTSDKFNEMLPTAIGSDPVLKVSTLGYMPKYEV